MQNLGNVIGGLFQPYAFETLSVTNTAVGLTASKYAVTPSDQLGQVQYCVITCETANARYCFDGTTPVVSTTGHVLPSGGSLVLAGYAAISQFKVINDTGGTSTLQVTYER